MGGCWPFCPISQPFIAVSQHTLKDNPDRQSDHDVIDKVTFRQYNLIQQAVFEASAASSAASGLCPISACSKLEEDRRCRSPAGTPEHLTPETRVYGALL